MVVALDDWMEAEDVVDRLTKGYERDPFLRNIEDMEWKDLEYNILLVYTAKTSEDAFQYLREVDEDLDYTEENESN